MPFGDFSEADRQRMNQDGHLPHREPIDYCAATNCSGLFGRVPYVESAGPALHDCIQVERDNLELHAMLSTAIRRLMECRTAFLRVKRGREISRNIARTDDLVATLTRTAGSPQAAGVATIALVSEAEDQ